MAERLQQEGDFKALPRFWTLKNTKSGAVAVNIEFLILEEHEGGEWASWSEFPDHHVYGDWWVVKRDGRPNQSAVDQLVSCLGWNGDLNAIFGDAPEQIVQINVKAEVYNGSTYYKATWMDEEGAAIGGGNFGADETERKALAGKFNSLLKAAASAKAKPKGKGPKGPKVKPGPKQTEEPADTAPCSKCGAVVPEGQLSEKDRVCLECDDIPFRSRPTV